MRRRSRAVFAYCCLALPSAGATPRKRLSRARRVSRPPAPASRRYEVARGWRRRRRHTADIPPSLMPHERSFALSVVHRRCRPGGGAGGERGREEGRGERSSCRTQNARPHHAASLREFASPRPPRSLLSPGAVRVEVLPACCACVRRAARHERWRRQKTPRRKEMLRRGEMREVGSGGEASCLSVSARRPSPCSATAWFVAVIPFVAAFRRIYLPRFAALAAGAIREFDELP